MALDVTKTLIDAVWAALEARTGAGKFDALVKAGNRVKTSETDYLVRWGSRSGPADFPAVFIRATGDNTDTPQRTFGTGSGCDYTKRERVTLTIEMAFDKIHDAAVMPVETEVSAALVALDAALLASPIRPAPTDWRRTRDTRVFNGTSRPITTWTTTTECRPFVSALTA